MILRKENLDDILDRLEELYEGGDHERARKELRRARRKFPQDQTLREWEATFLSDDGRYAEALDLIEGILAAEPDRPFARREKAAVLLGLGRHREALELLDRIGPRKEGGDAAFHFDRALCLDRLGREGEADREFKRAARLDPEEFARPLRLGRKEFEDLVRDALDEVPDALRARLDNVIVEVMDYPASPPLEPGLDPGLLGLYVGVPRTQRGQESRDNLDRIFVFKRNLEIEFRDAALLREEIRKTVIHEIAHHFGLEEDEMGEYA